MLKTTLEGIAKKRLESKEAKLNMRLQGIEQDHYHAYIMGYTSGGAAYGITWDELTAEEKEMYTYKTLENK